MSARPIARRALPLALALLAAGPALAAEPFATWPGSRLAVQLARGAPPILLQLKTGAGANGPFRVGLLAAAPGTAHPDQPPGQAAAAPVATPSVLDALAFETALEAKLAGPAPTPALQPVWTRIGDLYRKALRQPLWREGTAWSAAAHAVLARIALARDDALTPAPIAPASLFEGTPEDLAAQDLALTAASVAYARHAAGDRVDPARLSRLITARPVLPDPKTVLAAITGAGAAAGDALRDFNPPHAGYRALRDKLAEVRRAATAPVAARIPAGPPLRIGMRDPRVKLVRMRFGLEIATPETPDDVLYDTRVAAAVAGFQRDNGLAPSGVLTPRTVALLSGGEPRRLEREIIANMERWRWMPRDLGADRIEVDVADFTLALYRDNVVVHRARVVVGKPENPTPVFSNAMKFIVVNPSWYIPPSILKNEILPKLAADPGYLQRLGYEMTVKRGQVSVRQPPGDRNALGHIKFMFPNEHAVYLHDTPSRGLFSAPRRAFSHGCVRVDDPMALASAVLRNSWTATRIRSLVGGQERTLFLPTPLPIHIEYFTAAVGVDGRLQFREDIYGYDAAVLRALALDHDEFGQNRPKS